MLSPTNNASTGRDPSQQPATTPLLDFDEGLRVAIVILVQSMQTDEAAVRLGLAQDRRTMVHITDSGNTALLD